MQTLAGGAGRVWHRKRDEEWPDDGARRKREIEACEGVRSKFIIS